MKKNQIIILVLSLATLFILAGIVILFLSENWVQRPVMPEETIPEGAEENFYLYLELPSVGGKFLEFNRVKSEIAVLYFDKETMKTVRQMFKTDEETLFSKASPDPYQPDLFLGKELQKVQQETPVAVFYLSSEKEEEIPLARLIQVEN